MIDIKFLRENPDLAKQALASRGEDLKLLDEPYLLDTRIRELIEQRDGLRGEIKQISKEVGQLKGGESKAENKKSGLDPEELRARSKKLSQKEETLNSQIQEAQNSLKSILLTVPNLPDSDCPLGKSSEDNLVIKEPDPESLEKFQDYQRVPHWEFAVEMGILDIERAVKISGSMFSMFRGQGALLSNALIQYGLQMNRDIFEEIRPPSLVLTQTLTSTGHLPKFSEEAYCMEKDDLWASPTAEVQLTSLAAGEILEAKQLPMRLMAYAPCFRREAGSAGQQTRGLLRVHEFDKVEILAYTTPEQAEAVHFELLDRAEKLLQDLGLLTRIIDICTGDLGSSSARTFDIETYAPGVDRWLECSSVSWFSDYQARRADIRYRSEGEKGTHFVHTLNGSALAVPRVWATLVETHRQKDGTIAVPEVLQPFMYGVKTITGS